MDNRIDLKGLTYAVNDHEILRNVCLSVEKNRFVGLIGPNGSGKTTLLKHIYRALLPQKEVVFVNGKDIRDYSYREAAQQITVMRQENGSDFDYTILEMVLMGRAPYRKYYERDTAEDKEKALTALKYVGMEGLAGRPFSTLSGGEKQRVLIARSLAQEADILLLDEPTNHLDVHYQWLLMEIISGLGKTVLAVFHELNLACRYCDYIYVLQEGHVVAAGRPETVITSGLLADVFKINAEIITIEGGKVYIVYQNSIPDPLSGYCTIDQCRQ